MLDIHVQLLILRFLASQPSFGSLNNVNVLYVQILPLMIALDELRSIVL